MKYLIASDIHGSAPRLQQLLAHFDNEGFDMLLILGDILNYGPRNTLPDGLDANAVADMLNARAEKIIAVRGNCDSEVDQMLLHFPLMSDYTMLVDNGLRLLLTHGHIYNDNCLPPTAFDILCTGHTHLCKLERDGHHISLNTGSITFPKGGNDPTYATLDNGIISLHRLDGTVIKSLNARQ